MKLNTVRAEPVEAVFPSSVGGVPASRGLPEVLATLALAHTPAAA
ncbi:MAG: hypothetical protein Q8O29_03015 [Polaromonas sp.]|nr:hypothetical protein [Polaromonas sp.]MDP2817246.1 hypothetical protein [Polaromonas sp.]